MPRVRIASALSRWIGHTGDHSETVTGGTVREILNDVFRIHPTLRGYVLDETGSIRHHVVAFVDGDVLREKNDLTQVVSPDAELALYQALSGG